jgi:hypothetical protein
MLPQLRSFFHRHIYSLWIKEGYESHGIYEYLLYDDSTSYDYFKSENSHSGLSPVRDYGKEFRVFGQTSSLTKIHQTIRSKIKTSFKDMDHPARLNNDSDEESSSDVDSDSSDIDMLDDTFTSDDDDECDDYCWYVDVEPLLAKFAEENFEKSGQVGNTGAEGETSSEGDTYVTPREVQEKLPRFGACVGQRLALVATCDAARALLPYGDQEALKIELLGKPWAAATHRFPDEAEVVEYQVRFSTLMKKLNALWSLHYRSHHQRRVVRANAEMLFPVQKTARWDSLFDVTRFLHERYGRSAEQRRKLNKHLAALGLCSKGGKLVQFTGDDMKFLKEYVQVRRTYSHRLQM